MTQHALSCGSKYVRVDESAYAGIVIPGLEVIQVTLLVVDVATAAKMVDSRRFNNCGNYVAKRFIFVSSDRMTIVIDDGHDIALKGCSTAENHAVMLQCLRLFASGVEEISWSIAVDCLPQCSSIVDNSLGGTTGLHDPVVPLKCVNNCF